jgi:hypothetical protein
MDACGHRNDIFRYRNGPAVKIFGASRKIKFADIPGRNRRCNDEQNRGRAPKVPAGIPSMQIEFLSATIDIPYFFFELFDLFIDGLAFRIEFFLPFPCVLTNGLFFQPGQGIFNVVANRADRF